MGYTLDTKDKKRICATIEIGQEAADLVREKIKEVKESGVKTYGANLAIQSLLCEMWKMRKEKAKS